MTVTSPSSVNSPAKALPGTGLNERCGTNGCLQYGLSCGDEGMQGMHMSKREEDEEQVKERGRERQQQGIRQLSFLWCRVWPIQPR